MKLIFVLDHRWDETKRFRILPCRERIPTAGTSQSHSRKFRKALTSKIRVVSYGNRARQSDSNAPTGLRSVVTSLDRLTDQELRYLVYGNWRRQKDLNDESNFADVPTIKQSTTFRSASLSEPMQLTFIKASEWQNSKTWMTKCT